MTCEKCGAELIRGSLICRGCHHSNGPRTGSGRLSSGIEQPTGARLTRRGGVEGNLIQFPAGVGEEESSASAPTGADWKVEIRERVRESRERRGVVGQSVANREEAAAEKRNPIVESALNRLRQSAPPEIRRSTITRNVRGGAAIAALAPQPEEASRLMTATRPAAEARPDIGQSANEPPRVTGNLTMSARMAPMRSGEEQIEAPAAAAEVRHETEVRPAEVVPAAAVSESKSRPDALKTGPAFKTQIIEVPTLFEDVADRSGEAASLWIRALAGGCDFEIVAMAFLPIFAAYASLNTIAGGETLVLMGILLASLAFVYQAVLLTVGGRTFGMALLNLQLISLTGDEKVVTRRQKLMRAWGATVAFVCPPLNLLVKMLNSRSLTIPDLVSGTMPAER